MKKMSMLIPGVLGVAAVASGIYIMMNKKTRRQVGKVIDTAMDEMSSSMKNMHK